MSVVVQVDTSRVDIKFKELQWAIPEVRTKLLNELENFTIQTYKAQVPVSKPRPGREIVGRFRDSIVTKIKTANGFSIGPTLLYGVYPNYGVGPHRISAKRGKRLKFWWDKVGGWVYPRSVSHPGQKAQDFHSLVYAKVYNQAVELVRRYGQELVSR